MECGLFLYLQQIFLLGVGILYQKNKIPEKIQNFIKFIFEFDVSQKIALLVIATLLILYVGFSVGYFFENSEAMETRFFRLE